MFILNANKTQLTLDRREPVTSGSVNVYTVRFEFSHEWDRLSRTAIFKAGEESRSVLLGDSNETIIPWEVLKKAGLHLMCGIYGTNADGNTILPTIWADIGVIWKGAEPSGDEAGPPTPDLWQQALAEKGDKLDYTREGELGLYSGDNLLSSVPISGGGEGVADHRMLSHRGDEKQHPIEAIDGLQEELKRIPAPVEPMTNKELEDILK